MFYAFINYINVNKYNTHINIFFTLVCICTYLLYIYNLFLLFIVPMCYKIANNTKLANIELLFLEK